VDRTRTFSGDGQVKNVKEAVADLFDIAIFTTLRVIPLN
jgi:hypothetical protein